MQAESPRATAFLLGALGWSLGLFALLRSPWVQERLVLPLTRLQKQVADHYAGSPPVPVAVTLDCSGTDVLALCLATIVACPVPWRTRLARKRGRHRPRPRPEHRAHRDPRPRRHLAGALPCSPSPGLARDPGARHVGLRLRLDASGPAATRWKEEGDSGEGGAVSVLMRRFAPRASVLLVAFALCAPWTTRSGALLEAGAWVAHSAASLLTAAGLTATAFGNVLATSRGAFIVTPECIATALIPLYVAGVLTVRLSWPRRALALVAAAPLFAVLAIARLLVLALPPALADSPLHLVHGFHQLVLAVAGVVLLALWREPPAPGRWARVARRAGEALAAAAIFAAVAGHAAHGRGARRRAGRCSRSRPSHADGAGCARRRPGGARPAARLPGRSAPGPRHDGLRELAAPPLGLRPAARLPGHPPRDSRRAGCPCGPCGPRTPPAGLGLRGAGCPRAGADALRAAPGGDVRSPAGGGVWPPLASARPTAASGTTSGRTFPISAAPPPPPTTWRTRRGYCPSTSPTWAGARCSRQTCGTKSRTRASCSG